MAKAKPKLVEGIELHPPKKAIDHPVVTLEWCVSREITNLMRAHPDHQWAMLIVAQERLEVGSDGLLGFSKAKREERVLIEGIRRIGDGRTPFTFRAPVNYDVAIFLVRSKETSREYAQSFWKRLRAITKRSSRGYSDEYNYDISDAVVEDKANPNAFSRSDYMTLVATDNIIVSVPDGIFAKPKPKRIALVRAFGFNVGDDECDLRGRLIACFFASPIFLTLQLLWRGHLALSSVLHFLVGGNPIPVIASAFSWRTWWPAAGWFGQEVWDPIEFFHGEKPRGYLLPGLVLFALGYLWSVFFGGNVPFLGATLQAIAIGVPIGITLIVLFVLAISFFFGNILGPLLEKWQPVRAEKEIQRVEEYALCGTERPEGPRTFRLMASNLKSMVCRPNAN